MPIRRTKVWYSIAQSGEVTWHGQPAVCLDCLQGLGLSDRLGRPYPEMIMNNTWPRDKHMPLLRPFKPFGYIGIYIYACIVDSLEHLRGWMSLIGSQVALANQPLWFVTLIIFSSPMLLLLLLLILLLRYTHKHIHS